VNLYDSAGIYSPKIQPKLLSEKILYFKIVINFGLIIMNNNRLDLAWRFAFHENRQTRSYLWIEM